MFHSRQGDHMNFLRVGKGAGRRRSPVWVSGLKSFFVYVAYPPIHTGLKSVSACVS